MRVERTLRRIGLVSLLLTLWAVAAPSPPRPGPNAYVADDARLLSAQEIDNLTRLVRDHNKKSDSHLFVVTVGRSGKLAEAAKDCFLDWKLGEMDALLFLDKSERRARIHLGVSWGGRWEMEVQRIEREISEQGGESGALLRGAHRLLAMTRLGPSAALPSRNWMETLENLGANAASRSGLPWKMCLIFMGAGTFLLLCCLLPIGSSSRIFSAALGLVLLLSSYSAHGVLSAFWVVTGLGVLWLAGSAIQAGYQAGAIGPGPGGCEDGSVESSYDPEPLF